MLIPLYAKIVNRNTGEILFEKVYDDFQIDDPNAVSKMYRLCDSLLRGVKRYDDGFELSFSVFRYPKQNNIPDLFE